VTYRIAYPKKGYFSRPDPILLHNNLCALLEQERNITLSKSSMSRLLGHLGLTPQRPTYKSYKQDQDKINEYLVRSYPDVVAEAKKCKARIYFIDEASFRSDSHRGTTWGKIAGGASTLNWSVLYRLEETCTLTS